MINLTKIKATGINHDGSIMGVLPCLTPVLVSRRMDRSSWQVHLVITSDGKQVHSSPPSEEEIKQYHNLEERAFRVDSQRNDANSQRLLEAFRKAGVF